jgi:flagellum-specific ATP synthase
MIDPNPDSLNFDPFIDMLDRIDPLLCRGHIRHIIGLKAEASGPRIPLGTLCRVSDDKGGRLAEVVGFQDEMAILTPFTDWDGIKHGALVEFSGSPLMINVGDFLLGRVINGLGEPIDDLGCLPAGSKCPVMNKAPNPVDRPLISDPIATGIRAIDGLCTVGKGQRLGIFSGPGVGKSILLGMIARNTSADVNVIALIGERGREVREFIEKSLGEEGLKRSVVVVAISNESPIVRMRGAYIATAIAEYFRDQGLDVMFMMDSLTRFAFAAREVGLTTGEPPTTRGYTPSVFTLIPRLIERTGRTPKGSITGLYAVLVEGDDLTEPVSDTARSVLDGHIVLGRELADRNHWPAVDVLKSLSRSMPDITDKEHRTMAGRMRTILAVYRDAEDLINIGAYRKGSNPDIDLAIEKIKAMNGFLQQDMYEKTSFEEALTGLQNIFAERNAGAVAQQPSQPETPVRPQGPNISIPSGGI